MDQGLYHATTALARGFEEQEVFAENLANATVPGYRRHVAAHKSFAHQLERAAEPADRFAYLDRDIDHSQGDLLRTDGKLDVALDGPGFFAVQGRDGEVYTRNGVFRLAADGSVVTHEGFPVLGVSGPLSLDPSGDPPSIAPDGTIAQGEIPLGRLRVVDFDRPYRLESDGLYFRARAGILPRQATDTRVAQGFRERSNVNVVTEMVSMMTALRQLEMGQRALLVIDRTQQALLQNGAR